MKRDNEDSEESDGNQEIEDISPVYTFEDQSKQNYLPKLKIN